MFQVEKLKIFQASSGKALDLKDGQIEKQGSTRDEGKTPDPTKISHAVAGVTDSKGNPRNSLNSRQWTCGANSTSPNLGSSTNAPVSVKSKLSGGDKKAARTTANFFDRYFLACIAYLSNFPFCMQIHR